MKQANEGEILVQKYLSEFYTYKFMLLGLGRVVADPESPLEMQIQAHILAGNWAFFHGKYALALSEYLGAWGILPKIFIIEQVLIYSCLFKESVEAMKKLPVRDTQWIHG